MVASPQAFKVPDTQARGRAARALRAMLLVLSVAGGLGVAAHFALALWAQNEFTQPESIVVGPVKFKVRSLPPPDTVPPNVGVAPVSTALPVSVTPSR